MHFSLVKRFREDSFFPLSKQANLNILILTNVTYKHIDTDSTYSKFLKASSKRDSRSSCAANSCVTGFVRQYYFTLQVGRNAPAPSIKNESPNWKPEIQNFFLDLLCSCGRGAFKHGDVCCNLGVVDSVAVPKPKYGGYWRNDFNVVTIDYNIILHNVTYKHAQILELPGPLFSLTEELGEHPRGGRDITQKWHRHVSSPSFTLWTIRGKERHLNMFSVSAFLGT